MLFSHPPCALQTWPSCLRTAGCLLAILSSTLLGACSTSQPDASLLDKTLGLFGLQTATDQKAVASGDDPLLKALRPSRIALRIHAGDLLNSDSTQRPLSLVVKVYKLKAYEEFLRVPYTALSQGSYKGEEIVSSRELVLLPGQHHEVEESLPKDAPYLAVVALYKAPDAQRWRFVFDVANSAKDGITLGAHQCALSVSQGETVGTAQENRRLAGTVCR